MEQKLNKRWGRLDEWIIPVHDGGKNIFRYPPSVRPSLPRFIDSLTPKRERQTKWGVTKTSSHWEPSKRSTQIATASPKNCIQSGCRRVAARGSDRRRKGACLSAFLPAEGREGPLRPAPHHTSLHQAVLDIINQGALPCPALPSFKVGFRSVKIKECLDLIRDLDPSPYSVQLKV